MHIILNIELENVANYTKKPFCLVERVYQAYVKIHKGFLFWQRVSKMYNS